MNKWTLLRLSVRLLGGVDWLLGTHLVERIASRWRAQLEEAQAQILSLQTQLEQIETSREMVLRHMCLSYLRLRNLQLPDDWLHFDPRLPSEESAIDVLTRALVRSHWARWKVTQIEGRADAYIYDLVPDWGALHQDALGNKEGLSEDLFNWLAKQAQQKASE
jgi:hypothetical protein